MPGMRRWQCLKTYKGLAEAHLSCLAHQYCSLAGPPPTWLFGNIRDIIKKSAYHFYIEQAQVYGKLFKVRPSSLLSAHTYAMLHSVILLMCHQHASSALFGA